MRTLLTCILLFLLGTGYSQSVQLKDSRFTLLSPFQAIDKNKEKIYQLALAKYKINNQTGYALLLENHVSDFRFDLMDTTELMLDLSAYLLRQNGSRSWMEDEKFKLKRMNVAPISNSKGIVVAFPLTNEEAFDLKKDFINNMLLYTKDNQVDNKSINEPVMSLFIKNAAKVTTTKGSFDDVSRFKVNKIPFYSLMYKSDTVVAKKLGEPVNTKDGVYNTPTNIIKFYETEFASYEISFEENKAYDIRLRPKLKIKYSEYSFYTSVNGYPFELTGCDCGEFVVKQQDGATIDYYYRNKKRHRIEFSRDGEQERRSRFLMEVKVSD